MLIHAFVPEQVFTFVNAGMARNNREWTGGFTMVELLVVIAIIALLAALLLPALASAKDSGRKAACISNLRQIGIAIQAYAHENEGRIPYGPTAPPFTHPAEFYPSTGSPTSWLKDRYAEYGKTNTFFR